MNTLARALLVAGCGDPFERRTEVGPNPMELARQTTPATLVFIGVVLLGTTAAWLLLRRRVTHLLWKFLATAAGVMIFEFFTAPLWRNSKLGSLGYVYHDVSWILTLGWTVLILGAITAVNEVVPQLSEAKRYLLTLLFLLGLVLAAENVVVGLGIRDYAPEVYAVLSGYKIGVVPVEALYYVPVFTALVVAFARYWSFVIDDEPLVPVRRTRWLRALGLTALAVVLFEVMIEPLAENRNFPSWSYFYRDLSFLQTAAWVMIVGVAGTIVDRVLMSRPIPQRFAAALLLITVLALPLEAWLMHNGYRVYGPSATANFCGIQTWLGAVPVEIAFAIPLYMALVIGFVRYWEIVGDNNR